MKKPEPRAWFGLFHVAAKGFHALLSERECRCLTRSRIGFLLLVLSLCLFGIRCVEAPKSGVTVSGKTVYRNMGLEDVPIRVLRREGGQWVDHTVVKSGYHGSFVARLPPGQYILRAVTVLDLAGKASLALAGELRGVEIPADARRVDRLVIELESSPRL